MKVIKIIRITIFSLVGISITGFVFELVARKVAEYRYAPEGDLIEVTNHKLHVIQKGNGGPTVVFESGLDYMGHYQWHIVQNEVSNFSTTVSYDRAGILWSERGDNPKTGSDIAKELHLLLEEIQVPKPYILVAQSLGGYYVRSFVQEYSDDVEGIVLVDTSHPEQFERLEEILAAEVYPPSKPAWIASFLDWVGYRRLFSTPSAITGTKITDSINVRNHALRHMRSNAVNEEGGNVMELANEAGNITSFGNIPLIVISATSAGKFSAVPTIELKEAGARIWSELQADQLNLSTNSVQIFATNSAHYIQLTEPELIVQAVRQLLDKSAN